MQHVLFFRHGHYHQPDGVPSAHLPYGLSEAGRAQVERAARLLRQEVEQLGLKLLPNILTSHLPRARQSAEILAKEWGAQGVAAGASPTDASPSAAAARAIQTNASTAIRVVVEQALAERCLGSFANLHVGEIERILVEEYGAPPPPEGWKRSRSFCLPGVGSESLADAGRRVLACVEAHLQGLPAEPAAAASSGSAPQSGSVQVFVGHGGAFRHAAVEMGVLSESQAAELSMHYGGYVIFARSAGVWKQVGGAFKQRSGGRLD